ncbi:hypothetical protein ACLQ9N_12680, partial [Gallibacterium anatis]|uniref:hypothetical protein n=1 Tax=Gallibacterium anatis TaxID=750 RepID=UPI0039FC3228
ENDRWHHYLKGKAREKRQSKKTTPFLSNDFGKMGLSAVCNDQMVVFLLPVRIEKYTRKRCFLSPLTVSYRLFFMWRTRRK